MKISGFHCGSVSSNQQWYGLSSNDRFRLQGSGDQEHLGMFEKRGCAPSFHLCH
jgi:hypothetical protein